MSCYFLAQIVINDQEEYQKYIEKAVDIFSRYKGKYLAVDDNPEFLEGNGESRRIVLIQFPDEYELKRWYNSEEYQRILKHRLKAADCTTFLVNGLN